MSSSAAFEFVRALAGELSAGTIELPAFPDVALRIQRLLEDDNVSSDRITRVLGTEPQLATKVLTIANSAALNPSGIAVSDLRTAVSRMGFDMVRTAAMTFALNQLRRAKEFAGLEKQMNLLWERSVLVGALSYVLARRFARSNPDTALLAGLLHGVGKLYILTRASKYPDLFTDAPSYAAVVRDWHANIAQALLESWGMADIIIEAIHNAEDPDREIRGPANLTDILAAAHVFALYRAQPEQLEAKLAAAKVLGRLIPDATACEAVLKDSEVEIHALHAALES